MRLIHTPAPLFVPLLTRYFLGICRGKRCPALQPLHISLAFPHCTTTKQAKLGLVHPELRNVLSALTGFFLGGCKERQFTWPSCRGAEKIFDCGSWAECVFFKSDPEASVGSAYLRSVWAPLGSTATVSVWKQGNKLAQKERRLTCLAQPLISEKVPGCVWWYTVSQELF